MRNRKHDIEKYLRGELTPAEMHALEKEALSDPFLAEALEGVEQAGADNFLYDLHKLNRSVHDRTRRKSRKKNKTIRMWGWTSAVAATLLLLAVSGFIVVNLLRDQQAREQAMQKAQPSPGGSDEAATDTLTVAADDGSPLAAVEDRGESDKKSATPPLEAKKDKHRPAQKTGDPATAPDQAVAEQDDAAGEELAIAEQVEEKPNSGATAERERIASAETLKKEQAVAHEPVTDEQVSRSVEGRAAGVDVKRQPQAAAARPSAVGSAVVKGKVVSEDGHGLPGVNVSLYGTNTATVSDAEGNFQLAVPGENTRLQFGFIGFESKVVEVSDTTALHVTMEEDISTLSEVVVTGYGVDRSSGTETFHFAEPDGGKVDFKDYLAQAVKYPQQAIKNRVEGKVTVRFTVEPSGQLTDFEVLKGIGSGCEEELIRAIQQGPYWKPSTRGEEPVRDKVRVRYKFQLPK